jgi:rhomboid protease GluP
MFGHGYALRLAGITRMLLVTTVGVYLVQFVLKLAGVDVLTGLFGLSVGGMLQHQYWQLLSYMMLHGSPLHLLVNMLMLFFLGSELEEHLGRRHFLLLYALSGVLGGLGWLLLTWPYEGVCVGASGALFGLLGGFAVLFPQREVTLLLFFIFPITMRAWVLAVLLGLVQFFLMMSSSAGGVAYSAHLAGGVAGAVYVLALFRPELARAGWRRGQQQMQDLGTARRAERQRMERLEVDRLLDKVAHQGLHSLTELERRQLEKASERLRGR